MILTWILNAIMTASRDLWKVLKLLAGMVVIASQQVAGWIGALLLLATKSVIAQGLLLVGMFALLRSSLSGIVALLGLVFSWSGFNTVVFRVLGSHQGVMWLAYNCLDIDGLFSVALNLFSLWLSCWAVARGVQHAVIVTRFGILRGFWR